MQTCQRIPVSRDRSGRNIGWSDRCDGGPDRRHPAGRSQVPGLWATVRERRCHAPTPTPSPSPMTGLVVVFILFVFCIVLLAVDT